jgi:hypothetical protein
MSRLSELGEVLPSNPGAHRKELEWPCAAVPSLINECRTSDLTLLWEGFSIDTQLLIFVLCRIRRLHPSIAPFAARSTKSFGWKLHQDRQPVAS